MTDTSVPYLGSDQYDIQFIVHPNGCPGFVVIPRAIAVPVAEDVDVNCLSNEIQNVTQPNHSILHDSSSSDEDDWLLYIVSHPLFENDNIFIV